MLILSPIFVPDGFVKIISKVISISLILFIIGIIVYFLYGYYSIEDVPLDKEEAQQILSNEKEKYLHKSYNDLLKLMSPNEPDTYEIIGKSNTVYQIEVQSSWVDKDNKDEGLLILLGIDNGFRSAYSPLSDTFIKRKE
jgi:uncharacterized protein YpmB